MREDIADESVDLIYLDPPFNSKRIYNAFHGGAQWVAFDDTWQWHEAINDFDEVAGDPSLAPTMEGLRQIHSEGSEMAYLSYMANRLRECYRVLKPTGSIYLHCDTTMSHSLKLLMDGIFEKQNFRNEIIWAYRTGGVSKRWFGRKHDVLFFYVKSGSYCFNPIKEKSYLTHKYGFKNIEIKKDRTGWYTEIFCRDWWVIEALRGNHPETSGYPTQKPLALLERIIKASSNEGDVVLDPFCGCGTTLHAAQALHRSWIGIDVCVTACKVIEKRLRNHFESIWSDIQFIGMPKTIEQAKKLASLDKFRFERWAATLVDGMEANKKQRGDKGIDGRGRIAIRKGEFIDIVSQVKGGNTKPADVQAFNGARHQAGADLGVFTCFEDRVTRGMRDTAANTGKFMNVQKVQIYTIEDYFDGRKPEIPRVA